jgi:hypothetical protein
MDMMSMLIAVWNRLLLVSSVLWGAVVASSAQPLPDQMPDPGAIPEPPLLVTLATVEEQQKLQKDIADIERQNWTRDTLERRLRQWAEQRKLLLHKDDAMSVYLAVSQKLLQQSSWGKQLSLLHLLALSVERSQAVSLHQLPKEQRELLIELAMRGALSPYALFRRLGPRPQNLYLMMGALLYVEVPVEGGEYVRVLVKNLFPYPEKWGKIDFTTPPQRPGEEASTQEEMPKAMVILRTQLVDARPDLLQNALQKLIKLWLDEQERMRQQYEQAIGELRQRLARWAAEQIGLPLDTELSWNALPPDLAQKVMKKLERNNLSAPDLHRSTVKLGIALCLQLAEMSGGVVNIEVRPFGGDYFPARKYPYDPAYGDFEWP